MKKKSYSSLATRLSLNTIVLIGIIFYIILTIFHTYNKRRIQDQVITQTHNVLGNMASQIDAQISIVETAVNNTAWLLENNIATPDLLSNFLIALVKNNPLIYGSAIAFAPNYYPNKGEYFMLYTSRADSVKSCTQIGGPDYYYYGMDWYLIPKLLKQTHWSNPYFDEGGAGIIMSTYSYPLYDKNGKFFAVYTADISLSELTKFVEKLEVHDSSYSFILSKQGYYLTHPTQEKILNETIFSIAFEHKNTDYLDIAEQMTSGNTGTKLFDYRKGRSYAFYTSIPNIGWSVCNICPEEVIMSELDDTLHIIWIIFGIGALFIFIAVFFLIRTALLPLKGFAKSAQEIAKGRFDVVFPNIKSKDEMSVLLNSFEYMQKSLNDYMIELQETTAASERIESELHIAREIQMGMLPKIFPPFPERADVDLHAALKPAKEVGGDLYDFFIQEDKLYFIIGDVSGKGVPASLLMAVTRSLFRTISVPGYTPNQIVSRMNSSISEQNEAAMFVTVFLGILDLPTGRMSFCNAGHNYPVLIYPNAKAEYIDIQTNISLGLIEDYEFIEEEMNLEKGSKLFLYTDGVVEAEDINQKLYSEETLIQLLSSYPKIGVREMVKLVEESVAKHVGSAEPSDDLTILVINYKI